MAVAALAGWLAASGALDATASDKGVIAPGAALSKRGERHSATSVLHDSLLELHSTRVQGITCKHTGAIPTGLARRCDWVLMNSTNAGLIKYRSPPRTIFVSLCIGHTAVDITAEKILPILKSPVVLFTGSRDITLPLQRTCGGDIVDGHCKYGDYTARQKRSIRAIIESPMIERWNAENLVSPHPTKMAPMPLGFFPAHCQNDGVRKVNTFDAEADLEWGVCSNVWKTIRGAGSVPLLERPLVMACSGHVRDSPDYDHRRALASNCAENGPWSSFAIAPQEETDFEKFLTFLSGTSFTACAHGGGSDPAPKAFEAIAAGSIPIITSSALDGAYRKLPVVVIDSWDDASALTEENLAAWREKLAPHFEKVRRTELERRLTLDFWYSESLRGTSAAPAAPTSKEADDCGSTRAL
jgi:hypothetical protein